MIKHIKRKVRARVIKSIDKNMDILESKGLPLPSREEVFRYCTSAIHQVCLDHIVQEKLGSMIQQGIYRPFILEVDKLMRKNSGKSQELMIKASLSKWSDPKGKFKLDLKVLEMLLEEVKLLNSREAE